MTKIGKLIRACRADASRDKWAGELGVHPNTLKMYESGDRLPELDFLIKLSDKHGIPFSSLLLA
ncbi:MAG: helix-turn-helix domain-containing protein [Alphaproteobacteria bacterium]